MDDRQKLTKGQPEDENENLDLSRCTSSGDTSKERSVCGQFEPANLDFADDLEDEWEEEPEDEEDMDAAPLKTFVVFGALTALALVICVALWFVTHREGNTDTPSAVADGHDTDVSETLADAGTASDFAPAPPAAESQGAENQQEPMNPQDAANPQGSMNPQDAANPQGSENPQASTRPQGSTSPQDAANPQASTVPQGSTVPGNTPGKAQQQPSSAAGSAGGQASGAAASTAEPSEGDIVLGDITMTFRAVSESVTAKDVTNLRSAPSTADTENVVSQLANGASLERTGINDDTGWSRLNYQGQAVYAVSQYLTTDLNYKTPVVQGNPNRVSTKDGRVIIFVNLDDMVTPKEYVNLRVEPSTTEGDSTVRCQVQNGENLHRTGYSADSGWSRVEYNGEVLYVVSSLVNNVAAE